MSIRASLEQLLLRRFFLCPSFEIYGAVAGLYDYGPPLTLLQQHVLQEWRAHFCLEDNMLELECTNLTPEQVLRTSGHVERFADYMVTDTVTGDIFRADHLVKQTLEKRLPAANEQLKTEYAFLLETLDNYQGDELAALMKKLEIRAPETGNLVTEPVQFNLMFDTKIGPTGYLKGFLRPETAQGHFLNFRRLLDFNSDQMPFASASIGKSFRNEISPRQGLLRVREFTMAEIEHFVHPDKKQHARFSEVAHVKLPLYSRDAQLAAAGPTTYAISDAVASKLVDNETLGYFLARIYLFLLRIGISPEKVRFRQHLANEMAHYATDCWDAEILSSYGWIESVGCADRSAYDLTAHSKATGAKLVARETLAEPVTVTRRVLEIQKQKFGPAFKKDAKLVQAVLENSCVDGVWEKEVLDAFVTDLESKGYVTVKSSAGAEYKVTKEMITIVERTEKISVLEYTPSVIEPSFGIGRILYALLEHSYKVRPASGDAEKKVESKDASQIRAYFSFPASVAPTKALVLPLSNSPSFTPLVKSVVAALRRHNLSNKVDASSGSIGRRYARNDELGTSFAITVDFTSLEDGTVTLRERDSCRQIRASVDVVVGLVDKIVRGAKSWADVEKEFAIIESADDKE